MIIPIVEERSCKRCGGVWVPRKPEPPVQCPKCRSPYWDIPRGLTRIAREAVKHAPEDVDRVDLYVNQSLAGSVSVAQVPIVSKTKPSFGINVDDFLRDKGIGKPEREEDHAEIQMCSYKEYDGESGEWMHCGLEQHSPKVRHGKWVKQ